MKTQHTPDAMQNNGPAQIDGNDRVLDTRSKSAVKETKFENFQRVNSTYTRCYVRMDLRRSMQIIEI